MANWLIENTVTDFLSLADQFDALAATARTEAVKQGLTRLATRFRIFAARHAHASETRGGSADPDAKDLPSSM